MTGPRRNYVRSKIQEILARQNGATKAATTRLRRGTAPPHEGRPDTCDRLYGPEEIEYLRAVEEFKARTGVRFPAHTDHLAILKSLGYRKPDPTGALP